MINADQEHHRGLGRRRVLGAVIAGAVATGLAGCADGDTGVSSAEPADLPVVGALRNVKSFGAVGDGKADDTAAIGKAVASGEPGAVYLPAGTYRVTSWPEMPDHLSIVGDGGDLSLVLYEGSSTLISMAGKQRIRFDRMGIWVTHPKATALQLDGCFRCTFTGVVVRGGHTGDTYPDYLGQRGIVLSGNTGGTALIDCDINNFGVGIETSCIQNYLTSSKLATNHTGILGTGNDDNAGMAVTNSEFVSDTGANTTQYHVRVDGAANDWWFTNVWFEGADIALSIGRSGVGGPSQFGMVNCKVAARTRCIELDHCRQPYLANVIFDSDDRTAPEELRIDAGDCPEGTAVNLISSSSDTIAGSVFPSGWNVLGRGSFSPAPVSGTLVTQGGGVGQDAIQVRCTNGGVQAAVLSNGTWLSDDPNAGIVLKDAKGGYWRLVVTPDGRMTTDSLGSVRPR
ncbi:glycoside hydrolase family 55 protein [Gordonia sp. i37]|uniref:glycoside hydrolase family 55 protein n=1 Tax=Gordonia sp. i37 TaxID=1961707 RepID=UPI00209B3A2F|nr:glycoside hydrolase family 55 protein [Gordonia sp. i37]